MSRRRHRPNHPRTGCSRRPPRARRPGSARVELRPDADEDGAIGPGCHSCFHFPMGNWMRTGGATLIAWLSLFGSASAELLSTTGPLVRIDTSQTLSCYVRHENWITSAFTQCGTYLVVDDTLFGPAGTSNATAFTPVGKSAPSGTGTDADPYTERVEVAAGSTGVRVVVTTSYVEGTEDYQHRIAILNTSAQQRSIRLYQAGACQVAHSGNPYAWGYGGLDGSPTGPFCAAAFGRFKTGIASLIGPVRYFEGYQGHLNSLITNRQPLSNVCEYCSNPADPISTMSPAVGLSWDRTLDPNSQADIHSVFRSQADPSPSGPSDASVAGGPENTTLGSPVTYGFTKHPVQTQTGRPMERLVLRLPRDAQVVPGSGSGNLAPTPSRVGELTTFVISDSNSASGSFKVVYSQPGAKTVDMGIDSETLVYKRVIDAAPVHVRDPNALLPPDPPQVLTPSEGQQVSAGTLSVSWSRAPRAVEYHLFLDGGLVDSTAGNTAEIPADPGHHNLEVVAVNSSGKSRSLPRTFVAVSTPAPPGPPESVTGSGGWGAASVDILGGFTQSSYFRHSLGSSDKRNGALRFRPQLFFDKDERWRPLDVETFIKEGRHKRCVDRSQAGDRCDKAQTLADLFGCKKFNDRLGRDDNECFAASNGYLDIQGNGQAGDYRGPGACGKGAVWECEDAKTSKIQYHVVEGDSGIYYDYWFFYRFNRWNPKHESHHIDDHEGDWEGVSVWTLKRAPLRVFTVMFASHAFRTRYLRDTLDLNRDPGDKTGYNPRVSVFVARGSHASYPTRCASEPCWQPAVSKLPSIAKDRIIYETPYGGQTPWALNPISKCKDRSCLQEIPSQRVPAVPDRGTIGAWPGRWGKSTKYCGLPGTNVGCGPRSPGSQTRYKRPWDTTHDPEDHPHTGARTASVASTNSSDSDRDVACDRSWFGPSVIATVCDTPALRDYVSAEFEPEPADALKLTTTAPGARDGAAPGIAQTLADRPLADGQRVIVSGRASATTILRLRVVGADGAVRETETSDLRLDGSRSLEATIVDDGTAVLLERPDSSRETTKLALDPNTLQALATMRKRRVSLRIKTQLAGSVLVATSSRGRSRKLKLKARVWRTVKLAAPSRKRRPTRLHLTFRATSGGTVNLTVPILRTG